MMKTVTSAAAFALAFASPASAMVHAQLMRQVSSFKPMAGFNTTVGDIRFVGYFTTGSARCDVTVFEAAADDEALKVAPRRMVLQIAAGGRNEIDAGPDAALAIACTGDADALKLAPQARLRAAKL
jgi:hypothetical protein